MAYKLTTEQKEGANFIRTLNKQIEVSTKTFGINSETTRNLINLGNQYGLQTISKPSKLGVVQFSSSKKQLDTIINSGTLKSLKGQFYTKKGDIRYMFNVATKKAMYTREMKSKKKKMSYKEYDALKALNTKVAEKYDDFMESYIDNTDYKRWEKILNNLRNDSITDKDLTQIDTMQKRVIHGTNIVEESTGTIVGTIRDDTIYDFTK
mgnify:CR=1 FL=1